MNNQKIELKFLKTRKYREHTNKTCAELFCTNIPGLISHSNNFWLDNEISVTLVMSPETTPETIKYAVTRLLTYGLDKIMVINNEVVKPETGIKTIRTIETDTVYLESNGVISHLRKIQALTKCEHVNKFISDIITIQEDGKEE